MRVAVVSDIHGNRPAFQAVLDDAGVVEGIWCLGDTVGYGPEPNECVRSIRDRPHAAVAGNHEWAAIGRLSLQSFNPDAAAAARWTSARIAPDVREFIELLPMRRVEGEFTLVHGSPRNPIWEYLMDARTATACFPHFQTPYCLIGHTHIPSYFVDREGLADAVYASPDSELALEVEQRYILNPGSVGQPRDEDPRASYLLLDTERRIARWRRIEYDVAATQRLMAEEKLPRRLIDRLADGW